ncbi:hypothetical protein KAR10_00810, partial [bacterium]|nr:hypothetical protein [bacterium]
KKIYENEVDDKKKKDIEENIFKIDPKRFRLAALLDSKILPIHHPILENDTTRMEYSARLIEAMKHAIYGEIKEMEREEEVWALSRQELENMATYNPAGLIQLLDKAKTEANQIEKVGQALKQWGINDIADENIRRIIELGAAIMQKTQVAGEFPKEGEVKDELDELRGYIDYRDVSENINNQGTEDTWKIRGAALGMYYGIGGEIERDIEATIVIDLYVEARKETDHPSMLQDFFPVAFAIYMDMLKNDKDVRVRFDKLLPEQIETIIDNAEESIENDESLNGYIAQEVFRALAQLHNLTKIPEYRKKITNHMIYGFMHLDNKETRMAILDAWDAMWDSMDKKMCDDIVGLAEEVSSPPYDFQGLIRLFKLTNKRDKYEGSINDENKNEFIKNLTDKGLYFFDVISHMELAGDNAEIIHNPEDYDKVMKYLLGCMADSNLDWKLRLAAVKTLVKIGKPEKKEKEKVINKIWDKLDKDSANTVFYWALWELGADRRRIEEEVKKPINSPTNSDNDLRSIIIALCKMPDSTGVLKYPYIENLIKNSSKNDFRQIRPEILDYLAEEILSDKKTSGKYIEKVIEQVASGKLGHDGLEMLKKIYENEVAKAKKEYMEKVITEKYPDGYLSFLPDSEILPVKKDILKNSKSRMEYSARLIEAMKQAIDGKLEGMGPGEGAGQELEDIKQMLEVLPPARQEVVSHVNYGKLWREYAQAVENGDKEKKRTQYWRLIQGISAANTLETAQDLQNMYLYLLQRKKVKTADLESTPEILPKKYQITEITREIREQLTRMQSRMEEALDEAVNKTDDPAEKARLENIKAKLLRQEFIAPLKSSSAKKRIGFRFSWAERKKLEKVLKNKSGKTYRVAPALSEGNNVNLENGRVFGVAIIGILPWLQESTVSGLYLSGAILALLAYWGVNLIIPAIKSRISKNALSRAERGIKASDKFMQIIPSEIQYPPNANILKSRFWVFKHWPQLRVAMIGIMAAWPGRARLTSDTANDAKHDLAQRVLGSLAPNEPALRDILNAQSIELRRLPENIGWGQYLIGLVGQKWMEREGTLITVYLPTKLCDEYEKTAGQSNSIPGRLVSQLMAYMGERYYSGIYTNIHKAEGLLKTVKSDPVLARQFNPRTLDGLRLQNALEQLARGQTPEAVQRLGWVVLRALTLTKAENQPVEQRLLSMLEKVDPRNSIKVEVNSLSGKTYQLRLPAVILEKRSLYWLLRQKYPEGIAIIENKRLKLPEIDLRKYISQAA